MACDLERVFGDTVDSVPASIETGGTFIFSARTLPVPPAEMTTDQLIITRTTHDWHPVWRVDALWIEANKRTYRQLALLILAVVFHETPIQVHVALTHPDSDIKHLIIEFEYRHEAHEGYTTRPYAFAYSPQNTERHPWNYLPWSWRLPDLPIFTLTNLEDWVITPEQWEQRDTVRGCGSDAASVLFAELLLDAGCLDNPVNEYQLEGEGGFRGVGEHSVEVQLFLPGSLGWNDRL